MMILYALLLFIMPATHSSVVLEWFDPQFYKITIRTSDCLNQGQERTLGGGLISALMVYLGLVRLRRLLGMSKRKVYVYHGEGAEVKCRKQLFASLKEAVDETYTVAYIKPADIIEGHWVKDAALLAIGGGYDLGLIRALGASGIKIIRNYVLKGGAYLGLCSGGYFGCDFIEFDKCGPLEVCGERHLKFFPGLCEGPVFPNFKYNSYQGAVAAPTEFLDTNLQKVVKFHSYFNGGGHFQPYDHVKAIMKDHLGCQVSGQTLQTIPSLAIEHQTDLGSPSRGDNPLHTSDLVPRFDILAKYSSS
ncbi:biotin--protein ligase-like [Haliotis rubra]|uniref:biotin--protein ligase-like n=1 Tax=Haliotis rubra TaxID=36100 RepID=UPI001EE5F855|nr:biotin--protein ligase-like [Haliotis rubra]